MKYVIGIDLGTSAVKTILVNQNGKVCAETSKRYPLIQEKAGYSEQNPEDWVQQTIEHWLNWFLYPMFKPRILTG